MRTQITTITLPAHWASALVNGDYSGIDEEERVHVEKAIKDNRDAGWVILGPTDDEPRFTWHYPLYHPGNPPQGGEVLDYIIIRPGNDS